MSGNFGPSTAHGRAAEGKLETGVGNSACQHNLNVEVNATCFLFAASQIKFDPEILASIVLNFLACSKFLDKFAFFKVNNAPLLSYLNWGAYYVEL